MSANSSSRAKTKAKCTSRACVRSLAPLHDSSQFKNWLFFMCVRMIEWIRRLESINVHSLVERLRVPRTLTLTVCIAVSLDLSRCRCRHRRHRSCPSLSSLSVVSHCMNKNRRLTRHNNNTNDLSECTVLVFAFASSSVCLITNSSKRRKKFSDRILNAYTHTHNRGECGRVRTRTRQQANFHRLHAICIHIFLLNYSSVDACLLVCLVFFSTFFFFC